MKFICHCGHFKECHAFSSYISFLDSLRKKRPIEFTIRCLHCKCVEFHAMDSDYDESS